MRLRFNGFDAVVLVLVLVFAGLLLRSAFRHPPATAAAGIAPATRTVVFTLTTMPTRYASTIVGHLQLHGPIMVQTSGNFVPMGTLNHVNVAPYTYTVNDGTGNLIKTTDPTEHVLDMTIVAKAVVSDKTVSINGTPYYIDQHAIFHQGGSQFEAVITNEQVR